MWPRQTRGPSIRSAGSRGETAPRSIAPPVGNGLVCSRRNRGSGRAATANSAAECCLVPELGDGTTDSGIAGCTIDSPSGNREMHTFRKLPNARPLSTVKMAMSRFTGQSQYTVAVAGRRSDSPTQLR